MGEVVNLRLARKAKARSAKDSEAAENRIRFGQTKQERLLNGAENRKIEARLDGHRLKPVTDKK